MDQVVALETAQNLLLHLETIEFLIASFAASLFMVASLLASGIRWYTRIVLGVNMVGWAITSLSIKYPGLIEAYMGLFERYAAT